MFGGGGGVGVSSAGGSGVGERLSGMWKNAKVSVGIEQPEERSMLQRLEDATTLDSTSRMYGFGFCFVFGLIMMGLAVLFIWTFNIRKFALAFTLGNLLLVASTMFLMGPVKQIRSMMDKGRIYATGAFFGSMALTLFVTLKLQSFILAVPCVVVEVLALLWYCASYIPFGQSVLRSIFSRCMGGSCFGEDSQV
ncbi:unnamed protein product [Pedinophyceae sp. YPF-701]|nr:unnamed protein product [Pedinophyceae sp. YPF-701]